MRYTAVQRRLLSEDGVLDYGPSVSGSPAALTQATPPGAAEHVPGGIAKDMQPAPKPKKPKKKKIQRHSKRGI